MTPAVQIERGEDGSVRLLFAVQVIGSAELVTVTLPREQAQAFAERLWHEVTRPDSIAKP